MENQKMKRIFTVLMALVMIFCITGCKDKTKTKSNESKPKTTQTAAKKTEEKAKTEKTDASDKEKTEDAEQTDNEDQKSDDGEIKQEAKQTSNTGTSGNGSAGNSASTTLAPAQAQTTTTTAAPKQVGYTEADAQRFVAELKAYAVSIGWTLDPSLGPNNSGWGAEWSIDLAAVENGSTWMSYDNMMAKAKQELAQPIWGDYFHTINITYYNSGNGSWTFVPYTL